MRSAFPNAVREQEIVRRRQPFIVFHATREMHRWVRHEWQRLVDPGEDAE